MADDTDTARRALDERLDRAFEGATPAPITAAIDALIAAVRAETIRTVLDAQAEVDRRIQTRVTSG